MSHSHKNANAIKEVNPKKRKLDAHSKVCLWFVVDYNKSKFSFSMELVIQDKQVNLFIQDISNLVLLFFVHYFNMFNGSHFCREIQFMYMLEGLFL